MATQNPQQNPQQMLMQMLSDLQKKTLEEFQRLNRTFHQEGFGQREKKLKQDLTISRAIKSNRISISQFAQWTNMLKLLRMQKRLQAILREHRAHVAAASADRFAEAVEEADKKMEEEYKEVKEEYEKFMLNLGETENHSKLLEEDLPEPEFNPAYLAMRLAIMNELMREVLDKADFLDVFPKEEIDKLSAELVGIENAGHKDAFLEKVKGTFDKAINTVKASKQDPDSVAQAESLLTMSRDDILQRVRARPTPDSMPAASREDLKREEDAREAARIAKANVLRQRAEQRQNGSNRNGADRLPTPAPASTSTTPTATTAEEPSKTRRPILDPRATPRPKGPYDI